MMKKTYLQNREKRPWFSSWSLAVIALVFAMMFSPVRLHLSRLAIAITLPVYSAGLAVLRTAQSLAVIVSSKQKLITENDSLRAETRRLTEQSAYLTVLTNENNDLKELMGRERNTAFSSTTKEELCAPTKGAIGAAVLLLPAHSYYGSMLIDVGQDAGVAKGDPVYSFGDILLGTVADVYHSRSRIIFSSAAKVSTLAFLGKGHIQTELTGDGDGTFLVTLPKDVPVEVGDDARREAGRPSLLAKIVRIEKNENAPFQTIYLKSPVNLRTLEWVYVDRRLNNPIVRPCLNVAF